MGSSPPWLPDAVALGIVAVLYGVAGACGRLRNGQRIQVTLLVLANIVTLWYITQQVPIIFDIDENARVAGHAELTLAAAWGFYGLAMAFAEHRFSHRYLRLGARTVLLAALGYLMLGALSANARWAVPSMRFLGYVGVLGSIWAAEYFFRRHQEDQDINGVLSLAAAAAVVMIGGFEVTRWLEPAFALPAGQFTSPVRAQLQASTHTFLTTSVWGLYAPVLMAVGTRLRSGAARVLAIATAALALLWLLLSGLPNLTAVPWVRLITFMATVAGAGLTAFLAVRSPVDRVPREAFYVTMLLLFAAAVAVLWGGLEFRNLMLSIQA